MVWPLVNDPIAIWVQEIQHGKIHGLGVACIGPPPCFCFLTSHAEAILSYFQGIHQLTKTIDTQKWMVQLWCNGAMHGPISSGSPRPSSQTSWVSWNEPKWAKIVLSLHCLTCESRDQQTSGIPQDCRSSSSPRKERPKTHLNLRSVEDLWLFPIAENCQLESILWLRSWWAKFIPQFLVHHIGNLDGWMPSICGFLKYCSTLFNQRLTEGSPPWNSWNLGMPSYLLQPSWRLPTRTPRRQETWRALNFGVAGMACCRAEAAALNEDPQSVPWALSLPLWWLSCFQYQHDHRCPFSINRRCHLPSFTFCWFIWGYSLYLSTNQG